MDNLHFALNSIFNEILGYNYLVRLEKREREKREREKRDEKNIFDAYF